MYAINTIALVVILAIAAMTDLRERRIPNRLTVPGLALGLVLSLLPGGLTLSGALLGVGAAALIAVPLFILRAFGGGDAKLLLVVGAFAGAKLFFYAFMFTVFAGGLMALIATARTGMLGSTLRSTGSLALHLLSLGRRGRRVALGDSGAITIPYGVAIAIGTTLAWFGGF